MAGLVFADIETDGLNPTKIHCISIFYPSINFRYTFTDMAKFHSWVINTEPSVWVFHNGLGFDVPVINRLVASNLINPKKVIDTFVVSRLVNYTKFSTHSLRELGEYLGVFKGDYTGSWDNCSEEMIKYCEQDVEVLEAIYDHYQFALKDTQWKQSLRVEHDMAIVCRQMSDNGFHFNKAKAESLLSEIETKTNEIKDSFAIAFPPTLQEVNRIKLRKKKDGSLFSNVDAAYSKYPLCKTEGEELVCFDYVATDPNSPKKRIDILWDAGWKPTDKTDGYKKFIKDSRK